MILYGGIFIAALIFLAITKQARGDQEQRLAQRKHYREGIVDSAQIAFDMGQHEVAEALLNKARGL